MSSFRFASPLWLALLVLVPLVLRWQRRRQPPPPSLGLRQADLGILYDLPRSWRIRGLVWLPWFQRLGLALLVLGLARPQSGHSRQIAEGEGVDIVLALDISGSMAALDFQPQNRLEAARAVIGQFIEQRPFDRIGLVVFAREAFGHSPISVDHEVLDRQLDQVQLAADLGLEDGTAIGLGLANAANMLRASEAESRIIILLTDGANNSGQIDPRTAADAAASLGIRCYTIGMGRPGQVPIPVPGPFGDRIVYQESDLDEPSLRAIAETTGGLYFRAEDRQGLEQIYSQIDQLEKSKVEISQMTRYRELAAWALLPALLLLAGGALLGAGPLRTLP